MSASQGGVPSPGQPASPGSSFGIYRVMLIRVRSGSGIPDYKTYSGTLEALESAARSALRHNLRSGWWSLPGLIGTPFALAGNAKAMRQIRALDARAARGESGPGQRKRLTP